MNKHAIFYSPMHNPECVSLILNITALMKLGNETKNVVCSRKQNSRPQRKVSKLFRKEKPSNPKSNDKQDSPNAEYDGKTIFVSENTTSLDHTKKYHELKNTEPISQGMMPKLHNCFESLEKGVQEIRIGNSSIFSQKNLFTKIKK